MISRMLTTIMVAALVGTTPGDGRRINGWTRAEWRTWMLGYTDHDWSVHCAEHSTYSVEEWDEFFAAPVNRHSVDDWITWWNDLTNWT